MESLTGEDPRSVGGYELRARLGSGGFGQVYLGLSPAGRAVAIKVLRPELTADRQFLWRFRSEVEAARQVNGFSKTAAQARLKTVGFTHVRLVPDHNSVDPLGDIDDMTPAPGSYPPGQQITLYVSAGLPVPDVVNQTAAEATAILEQDGFRVQTITTLAPADEFVEAGTVYSQKPAAKDTEPKGALIQIFVQPETVAPAPSPTPSNPFFGGF